MQEKSGSHFKQAGIFPVTYVKLPECKSNANDDDRDRYSLFNEGKVVASNWSDKWRTTYKEGELMRYQYEVIYRALAELIELENSIINSTLPQDEQKELKLKLAHKMGWGNRRFGFDLIPRDGYKKVDPIKVGAVELYRRVRIIFFIIYLKELLNSKFCILFPFPFALAHSNNKKCRNYSSQLHFKKKARIICKNKHK